jgi:hypothetical protein
VVKGDTDTREILDFLSLSARPIPTICPNYGSSLELHTAKFFWAGRAWNVPFARGVIRSRLGFEDRKYEKLSSYQAKINNIAYDGWSHILSYISDGMKS